MLKRLTRLVRIAGPAVSVFLRTPTLSRQVLGLLSLALVLLLIVNVATFVMIRRTAEFNDGVEAQYELRRLARDTLVILLDAETGQRGYLLTGDDVFLEPYTQAVVEAPRLVGDLRAMTDGDADLSAGGRRIAQLTTDKLWELERTVYLARTNRRDAALAMLRTGTGKAHMDAIRAEIDALQSIVADRLAARRQRSELAAAVTVGVNALDAALILVLAVVSGVLVRRYIADVREAHDALDRLNAGLEDQVRSRTAALTRANEEIQRFAYIVSHDLRAPLVNIMGYTAELEGAGRVLTDQIARLEARAPRSLMPEAVTAVREDLPEAVGFIRASTEKMDRLIKAILKLSREGRRNLLPEPLDVRAMVQTIADSVRHQTEQAGAEIVVEPLPTLDSDRLSLEQVFGNLIDNAVKYLDRARPGRIVVSGEERPGGWVVYRVADNGRGVAPKDHERIFELFRRSGRQDRPGEGLGLAFVRSSVRRLGGMIDVQSELGRGSTFVLQFPKRLMRDVGETE